ncbi:MAG: SUF system Fe-S cluster assembly regulator [Alphaproteobacteria bacterium]|nr:SUF system Fe-S cluster assembly regulator [Alphaproteobacteria bacterium]
MVRLSKLTDYAVVLLTQMVSGQMVRPNINGEGKIATHSMTTASLAQITGLPHPTVSKILKKLSKTGLLVAQRGATGGYTLARDAQDISVADIVTALDGPIALTDCAQGSSQSCQMERKCPINGHWNRVNIAIRDALQSVSLAEMAQDIKIDTRPFIEIPRITEHRDTIAAKYQ